MSGKKAVSLKKLNVESIKVNKTLVPIKTNSKTFTSQLHINKAQIVVSLPQVPCTISTIEKTSGSKTILRINLKDVDESVFTKIDSIDQQIIELVTDKWNRKIWFNDDDFACEDDLKENYKNNKPLCKWMRTSPRSREKAPCLEFSFDPSLFTDANNNSIDTDNLKKDFFECDDLQCSLIVYLKHLNVKNTQFSPELQLVSGKFNKSMDPPSDSDCDHEDKNDEDLKSWEQADDSD